LWLATQKAMTKNNSIPIEVGLVENTTGPIPLFPYSKKLTLEDKNEIEYFVKKFPFYSDYNFTSLFCYNINNKVEVSWLNGNLVVLFQDYITEYVFYSFLGENQVTETALTLLNYAESTQTKAELRLIPDYVIKLLGADESIIVREDENNFDYILSIPALAEYKGKEFSNKRNHTNQFKRKYPNHNVRLLDLNNEAVRNQLLEFCKSLIEKNLLDISNSHELQALECLLKNKHHFNVYCFGIFVDDKLASFLVCEQLNSEYIIGHFEKSDIYFDGISPFLIQEVSKYLKTKGFRYFNYEQDLGITGLRTVKQRYRPAYYLKKYIITKK
jgi:hypothetical protein